MMRARFFALAAAALLAGCQTTPSSVYELADKTSGNAGVLQGHLAELAARSDDVASRRAAHIADMEAFNAQQDAALRRSLYFHQQSRSPQQWAEVDALLKQLQQLQTDLLAIEQSAVTAAAQRRKDLMAQQQDLNTYKAALRDTATALDALAKHESASERARFLAGFAREVRAEMKASLEKGDQSAKAAQDLIDSLKKKLADDKAAPDNTP